MTSIWRRLLHYWLGRPKPSPEIQSEPARSRDEYLQDWVSRINRRRPVPADLPPPSLAAHYVADQEARLARERLLLEREQSLITAGYTLWRTQPPPIGVWIETVRRGEVDNSEVWRTDAWTPGRTVGLLWRQTSEPIQEEP